MSYSKQLADMAQLETSLTVKLELLEDHYRKKGKFAILANIYLDINIDSVREGSITITDEIKKQILFLSEFYSQTEDELKSVKKFIDNIEKITLGDLENALFKSVDSVPPEVMEKLLDAWDVFAEAVEYSLFETPDQKKWVQTRRFKLKKIYKRALAYDQLRYGNAFINAEEKSIMFLEKAVRVMDYYEKIQSERIKNKLGDSSK